MKRTLLMASAAAIVCAAGAAHALPVGPTVAGASGGPGASFSSAGSVLNVNQSATRVVIDWQSFNIAPGETVNFNQAAPNWIAFNIVNVNPRTGVSPLSTLAGSLNARGGVWLFSTGGVIFGPTARIDVGSFAAITAPLGNGGNINQLLTTDPKGLTTVAEGAPIGVGVEQITVQNGAQVNASSGYVVLQAETITQDGAITAADGVGYAVAETGQTQFLTSPTGQQLQSAGITLLVGQDRPSFTHLGSTHALWVGIDTPGGTMQAGYHTLINLGGTIDATGVKPDGSDKGVVLLVGGHGGPGVANFTGSSIGVNAANATITATHGLFIDTDSLVLGKAAIGGPIDLETYGNLVLTQPVTSGLTPTLSGDVRLASNGPAGIVTVGGPLNVRGDLTIAAAGAITLSAPAQVNGSATFVNAPTGSLNVDAPLTAGGGLNVFDQPGTSGGPVKFNAPVAVGSDTFINGTNINLGSMQLGGDLEIEPAGNVVFAGNVDAGGGIALILGSGSVTTGSGVALNADGQIFMQANGDITLGGPVTAKAFDAFAIGGALTVAPTASITTTGTSPAPIWPIANTSELGAPTPPTLADGPDNPITLGAARLVIEGPVTAGPAGDRNDIYLQDIAGLTAAPGVRPGPLVVGGAPGAAGFQISDAELKLLTGRNLIILGGPAAASANVDIDVGDVTLDSTKLSGLWLGTASTANILVSGDVTVTGGQPFDVQLGFARGSSFGAGLDAFIPGDIEISGSLGSASAPLTLVGMIARGDILLGPAGFISAAQGDPNFDASKSSSAFPGLGPDHAFVTAGSLQLATLGRIIQQNTSPNPLGDAGIRVGAPGPSDPLVFAPAALSGVTFVGGGGWTATYGQGPTRVDLFGDLGSSAQGAGPGAARLPNLLDPTIKLAPTYRINGCTFGAVCLDQPEAVADVSINAPLVALQSGPALPDETELAPASDQGDTQDNDRLGSANPVTETGDRERWVSHAPAKP